MAQTPPVELVNVNSLKSDGKNPNQMTTKQRSALKENIKRYGFLVPIITNRDLVIADGEHRLEAAKDLGMPEVPVIRLDVDEVDRRLLRQVMNKLRGEHDPALDKAEFQWMVEAGGFERLQSLLGDQDRTLVQFIATRQHETPNLDDLNLAAASLNPAYAVKKGDLWRLGAHLLLCGDATEWADIKQVLFDGPAQMTFTDPPYNVAYNQDKSPTGKPNQSKGEILNDDMTGEAFEAFLSSAVENILEQTNGGVYICMGNSEFPRLRRVFEQAGGHWSSTIIWNKSSFVMGHQDYHRKHEPIFYGYKSVHEPILYGWKEGEEHYFTDDRTQCDVWDIAKPTANELHPTQKPVELATRAIGNSSRPGEVVLDPFGGSGTTLMACERMGRSCRMLELDPVYVSVIIQRWENATGQKAEKVTV